MEIENFAEGEAGTFLNEVVQLDEGGFEGYAEGTTDGGFPCTAQADKCHSLGWAGMGNVQKIGQGRAQRCGEVGELEDGKVGAAGEGLRDMTARESRFSGQFGESHARTLLSSPQGGSEERKKTTVDGAHMGNISPAS